MGNAPGSTSNSGRVATTSGGINSSMSTHWVRICCGICEVYGVTGVSHPVIVYVCDGGITWREAEGVNANPSSEITGSGAQGCEHECFVTFVWESYSAAFSEKVSHDSAADFLTLLFVAIGKQARH